MKENALAISYGTDTSTNVQRLGWMATSGHYMSAEFIIFTICADYRNLRGSHTAERLAETLEVCVVQHLLIACSLNVYSIAGDKSSL